MTDRTSAVRRLLVGAAFAATFAASGLLTATAASARQDPAAQEGQEGGDHMGKGGGLRTRIDHMLTIAQATPQQKAKIQQILKSAFEQAAPLRRKAADAHRELGRLLTLPKIDRAAIERARAEHVAATDQAGRILVKAFADAAEVLTTEQRARIAAEVARHRAH